MKLTLELSLEETNLILASLSKLSYESSVDVITKIRTQAQTQLVAKQADVVAETEKPAKKLQKSS